MKTCAALRYLVAANVRPLYWKSGTVKVGLGRLLQVVLIVFFTLSLHALPSSKPVEDIPPLAPPLPEIPPTLWERFGWTLWIWVPLLLAMTAMAVALWLRPRKPPQLLAPVAQARAALTALQARPEDGATLSEISRVVRRYLINTFWLRPEEMTTSEFCTVLNAHAKIGPELSAMLGEFFRNCDERKFSPATNLSTLGAAGRGLELIEITEAHRAAIRTATTPPPLPSAPLPLNQ